VPPAYVKPYVRRNKTDAADAAAICEALRAPGLHLVAVKSEAQQAVLALHRTRELLVRQCTMTTNALRALLAEFGVVAAQGQAGLSGLLAMIGTDALAVPPEAGEALAALARQLRALKMEIGGLETRIVAWHKCDAASRRLASIPGIGPITASALAAMRRGLSR
jgi:transposase